MIDFQTYLMYYYYFATTYFENCTKEQHSEYNIYILYPPNVSTTSIQVFLRYYKTVFGYFKQFIIYNNIITSILKGPGQYCHLKSHTFTVRTVLNSLSAGKFPDTLYFLMYTCNTTILISRYLPLCKCSLYILSG